MKRRQFLNHSLLYGSAFAAGPWLLPRVGTPAFAEAASRETLAIPPLLEGESSATGSAFSLRVGAGSREFFPGLQTPTLGINGDFLGPTLRMHRGERAEMNVRNDLDEVTTLHWHGLHLPPAMDGGPHQLIQPGTAWRPAFDINQRAGTFWYHSHVHRATGEQVYRGLAGMLLVEDGVAAVRGLPSEYGVDDIPLILTDRRFNRDGSFDYIGMHRDIMMGVHGDTMLVNGTVNPQFQATTQRVRFRVLNACNARTMEIGCSDQRSFLLVGNDGGLLPEPISVSSFVLAPSERAELVIDVANGMPVQLMGMPLSLSSPYASNGMMAMMSRMIGGEFTLLHIEPASTLATSDRIADQLVQHTRLAEADADRSRQFTLNMQMGMMGMGRMGSGGGGNSGRGIRGRMMGGADQFSINGAAMDMSVINERVPLGSTEIWEVHNNSMMMHPFHIHDGQFQVLSRSGRALDPLDYGDKDTVKIGPGETVRLIKRFNDFADAESPYMYHCHILEHEDNGMMGQYVVV